MQAELPPDLQVPTPRALPPWARRTPVSEVVVGLAVAVTVGFLVTAREYVLSGAIVLVAGAVEAVWLAVQRSWYRLLREGRATSGTITEVDVDGRHRALRFQYDTHEGPVTSTGRFDRHVVAGVQGLPQPGDTVFLVYDPRAPTRNELWASAPGSQHDATVARELERRRQAKGAMLLGVFLVATCGLPLALQTFRHVPLTSVVSCERTYSHHYWFHLVLGDGTRLTLKGNEVDLVSCPPPGTTIEKQRGELAWRLDGQYIGYNEGAVTAPGLLALLGFAALAVGVAKSRASRTPSAPSR